MTKTARHRSMSSIEGGKIGNVETTFGGGLFIGFSILVIVFFSDKYQQDSKAVIS